MVWNFKWGIFPTVYSVDLIMHGVVCVGLSPVTDCSSVFGVEPTLVLVSFEHVV